MIKEFDRGNDDFKEELYKLHKITGLRPSSQFESFLERLKNRQEQKRQEQKRKKEEKEKGGKKKKSQSGTTVEEQGEICIIFLRNL